MLSFTTFISPQSLPMQQWLTKRSLCRPDWSWNHSDSPVSVSLIVELKTVLLCLLTSWEC